MVIFIVYVKILDIFIWIDLKNIKDKVVVVFVDVILNIKNVYIVFIGEFIVFVRGYYIFILIIFIIQGVLFSIQFVINGNFVCYNYIKGIFSGKKIMRFCF